VRQLSRLILKIQGGGRTGTYNSDSIATFPTIKLHSRKGRLPRSAIVLLCAISPLWWLVVLLLCLLAPPIDFPSSVLVSPSVTPRSLQRLVMEKPSSPPEGGHPAHLRRALLKGYGHQRRTGKLEYRKKVEREMQNGKLASKNIMVHRLNCILI